MKITDSITAFLNRTASNIVTLQVEMPKLPDVPGSRTHAYAEFPLPYTVICIETPEALEAAADVLFLAGWDLVRTTHYGEPYIETYKHQAFQTEIGIHANAAAYSAPTA